ncbi:uncharacterized protein CLUP02_12982 [Colletotrichum lupini]|uniref:Uncharacterized protein n=2 Tax=Colletotrichum acutatum species complex TaxID=2707335 RepID=A0A9Q8T1K8_9PEZI|nr:uncharacterized protein CLUP02_12982 [Colletotrichum lupini]XP_060379452.1 uncharacterized protein CTAM01_09927 [Colletotrichum tamarilloi]KAK1492510.1 hypothetical protein CTAM01_09927 [Colletotrichum tamarilloi]UQC87477.1 hypothetical protein CLUP02_12982 [Colletotrichum lupini]
MSHHTWKIKETRFETRQDAVAVQKNRTRSPPVACRRGVPGAGHRGGETIVTQRAAKTLGTATLGTTAQNN